MTSSQKKELALFLQPLSPHGTQTIDARIIK